MTLKHYLWGPNTTSNIQAAGQRHSITDLQSDTLRITVKCNNVETGAVKGVLRMNFFTTQSPYLISWTAHIFF